MRADADALSDFVCAHADELADAAVRRVRTQCDVDNATTRNLRVGVLRAISLFGERVADAGAQLDLGLFEAHGRAQRAAGRSLDEMLSFYRVSGAALWARVEELADLEGLTAGTALILGEQVMRLSAELSQAAAAGFDAAGAEAARRRNAAVQRLWTALTRTRSHSTEDLASLAAAAEWSLPERLRFAVATIDPGADPRAGRAVPGRVLVRALDDGVCGLLVADGPDGEEWLARAVAALGLRPPLVIGSAVRPSDGAAGLTGALSLLARAGAAEAAVIRCDDHLVELLLARAPEVALPIAERHLAVFAQLRPARREALLATLAAWLDHPAQPQRIAERLGLHVQTVRYRMRRLREVLGDSLDDPRARLELALALRASGSAPPWSPTGSRAGV